MSDVKATVYLLTHDSALTAVVAAAKIMPGAIPQGTAAPTIGVMHVSTIHRRTLAMSNKDFCTSRVQITVQAASYPQQKQVLKLVRSAIPENTHGTINGVDVDSVLHEIDGPDFRDDDEGVYVGSVDFLILYNE